MLLSNFHTHTTYCDGASTPVETVESAIQLGLSQLGFSSHSPLDGEDWCLSADRVITYFNEISALKERYKDKIRLFVGIEQDFMSDKISLPFDYIIGSVHSVETAVGEKFVDISSCEVAETVNKYFGGDVYTLAEAYYDRVGCVVEKTGCDIIGHFDLVTKFTECGVQIDESHPRYIAAQDKALDRLLLTNAIFEVNTGAMARGYRTSPFPSARVLERIREAGRPVVINSDSHTRDGLTFGFDMVRDRLSALSVRTVSDFREILDLTRK